MTLLEISQIIFNLVSSIATVVVSALIAIIAFEIIKCIQHTKKMVNSFKEKSNELYQHIDNFIASLSALPFISTFFRKKKTRKGE